MADAFTGFSTAGLRFLGGLTADNTREYFTAHRPDYEAGLLAPAKALVPVVADELRSDVAPALQAEPAVGKSLFRINRDLRFSKDNTPYNPWIDAVWWEGSDDSRAAPAFLFRLAADYLVVGCGVMAMAGPVLGRYREAVADDARGGRLADAVDALRAEVPAVEMPEPALARVPRPYPADHPRGELLRCKTLHATRRLPHPPELTTPAFAELLAGELRVFAPVHRWLVDNVAPALGGARS